MSTPVDVRSGRSDSPRLAPAPFSGRHPNGPPAPLSGRLDGSALPSHCAQKLAAVELQEDNARDGGVSGGPGGSGNARFPSFGSFLRQDVSQTQTRAVIESRASLTRNYGAWLSRLAKSPSPRWNVRPFWGASLPQSTASEKRQNWATSTEPVPGSQLTTSASSNLLLPIWPTARKCPNDRTWRPCTSDAGIHRLHLSSERLVASRKREARRNEAAAQRWPGRYHRFDQGGRGQAEARTPRPTRGPVCGLARGTRQAGFALRRPATEMAGR